MKEIKSFEEIYESLKETIKKEIPVNDALEELMNDIYSVQHDMYGSDNLPRVLDDSLSRCYYTIKRYLSGARTAEAHPWWK